MHQQEIISWFIYVNAPFGAPWNTPKRLTLNRSLKKMETSRRSAFAQSLFIKRRATAIFCIFIAACCVFFFRRPDILSNPQFWAEDGSIWFSQAYNYGIIRSLLMPHTGYFQTISRLTMGAASLFPLEYAPLFSNFIAISVRSLCVAFLFSRRFDFAPLKYRVPMALYFMLMPGLQEVHCNITNTHWYLAIYSFMILLAPTPSTRLQKIHDSAAFTISGLSGPFVVFLFPLLLLRILLEIHFRWKKGKQYLIWAAPLGLTFVVQTASLLLTSSARENFPLGASIELFFKIINMRIMQGFIYQGSALTANLPNVATYSMGLLFVFFLIFVFFIFSWRTKMAVAFLCMVLITSLATPMGGDPNQPVWPLFLYNFMWGSRYFVIINILFFGLVLRSLSLSPHSVKIIAGVLLAMVLLQPMQMEPYPKTNFYQQVEEYKKLPKGSLKEFDIQPQGWKMTLEKK